MTRTSFPFCLFTAWVVLFCGLLPVHGDLITDPGQLSATNTIIDFESFSPGAVSNSLVIGDATFSSSTILFVLDVSSFDANGGFVFGNTLATNDEFEAPYVDLRIDFADTIGEVGLGWFDPNFSGNRLEVYDSSNSLLEIAEIPIGPTGGKFAAFRGIRRSQNDISYAIARVSSPSDVYSIDNVSFGTAVPEPSSFLMLGVVGAGVVATRRRKRVGLVSK